jgi:hypothetical protein
MPLLTPNEEWARDEIVGMMSNPHDEKNRITTEDVMMISTALKKLDALMFKSWSKDLTLNELRNVLSEVIDLLEKK